MEGQWRYDDTNHLHFAANTGARGLEMFAGFPPEKLEISMLKCLFPIFV